MPGPLGITPSRSERLALLLVLIGCLAFTAWSYWPGQSGSYILDDRGSLLPMRVLAEEPGQFWHYVRDDRSGRLGRSVSALTFALEYSFTDGSVATIKRHSILLHLLIGLIVFWLALLLCRVQGYPRPGWLALLAMAIWLLAPQQSSTVLYAVQRMAQLAALLVLLALLFYLKARTAPVGSAAAWLWGVLCVIAVLLAPFAKENGVLAVPLIIILEACFLRGRHLSEQGGHNSWLFRGAWLSLCLGLLAFLGYFLWNMEGLERSYSRRSFSLAERLLTQPRVLWDYLAKFYWPDLARLGVYHDDFPVSTSLREPPGTWQAVSGWVTVIVIALGCAWRRVFWFLPGLLFFYLAAHGLESSFIALELYFEHRNYLPSVALALLPVMTIGELGRRWQSVPAPILVWLILAVLVLASGTATQVQVWSSPTLLALHHLNGHPESVRANNDIATRLAELGDYEAARHFSEAGFRASQRHKAARLERDGDYRVRNLALACLARTPVPAAELTELGEIHPERPIGDVHALETLVTMQLNGQCPSFDWHAVADRLAQVYLIDPLPGRASVATYAALSALVNSLERISEGGVYADLGLAQDPDNPQLLLMRLHYATLEEETAMVESIKLRLLALEQEGRLAPADRNNLAFYL